MVLPVLPRHVHEALGQGTVMVGLEACSRASRTGTLAGFSASCGVALICRSAEEVGNRSALLLNPQHALCNPPQ